MNTFLERLFSGERDAILVAAAAYFALAGVCSLVHMFRLSRWPSVIGELHEEGVKLTGFGGISPDEREYKAVVRYSYSVDGLSYENDCLNPWIISVTHNLRSLLQLQFRGIKRHGGTSVSVYFNPRKPQKSYLDVPDWPSMVLVGGTFLGSAALILSAL
ncbi:Protein of unknown function [Jannaschia faecimaris]|uniref:DUF3592 domain-containing protein n=1 Tax=Jannaschia faecimaris TaxID=1244108 RepID=A0A1H3QIM4_9RHOB|nr:DUF3592 domain-containing protein [Jannaschia faecimaris]SDZ12559.1 Protein of unknown function [Jannaschia faecimaris]